MGLRGLLPVDSCLGQGRDVAGTGGGVDDRAKALEGVPDVEGKWVEDVAASASTEKTESH